MEALRVKLDRFKQTISRHEREDKEFRMHMREVFANVFGASAFLERGIKDFSRSGSTIHIAALNKTFAQELFLKKDLIHTELAKREKYAEYTIVIA